ncbi:hypothetical protein GUITHDRAFT_153882 [Guillardia theta CCMP2712]|uniref:Uncharacterized protein n=2 Tax=Guillardia theta TaxID=55529 RepID=L1IYL5_GUITC|nr:hypothetical protein GUITHDRAFT_153882 [Guillardia theta CCMP2712]EKX41197.1 hypothetical protein GUITHDRAFT_153882 [Guillardia theta CCMP2712]|eukprot:XP_005828177.1 hypothetical protein GUITHDRAFT_153882 [Guillardia theta CCMP2712]
MAASRSHEMETLRSGNAANGGQQTGDDEAVARALQEEYDRENRELAQARMHAPLPDYRRAGYQDPSYSSHDPPTIVHVACSTCRDINAIPFSPAPIDFRCCRCGFLNRYHPPRAHRAYYDHVWPAPVLCTIS